MLAVGSNGVGKTNLLEAVHVGTQGFSPRTRREAELVRFGASAGRVAVRGERGRASLETDVVLRVGDAKRARLNGAPLRAAEQLRQEAAVLVFTPDRLAVVKGGPAVRRAYFDRVLTRVSPSRALLPAEYAAAVGQRNAALRRVAAGFSSRDALDPWTERVVELGAALVAARAEVVGALTSEFAETAGELGLPAAALRYDGDTVTLDSLHQRVEADLERGTTGAGPHLHDVTILSSERELRSFGSQGEQRLAVLALLLAEADVLAERNGVPPLLLLDDVLSELDEPRRTVLARRIAGPGQALVTATSRDALPGDPDLLIEVVSGAATRRR